MNKELEDKEVEFPCDECGKEATYNIQECRVLFKINKRSHNFKQIDMDNNGDNKFYCEEHFPGF